MIKLTKLVQISDNVIDRALGVHYYSFGMYFGNEGPLFAHLSHQGAAYLAHSAGISVSYAKGTEGYQEEQDARKELLSYGSDV